MYSKMPTDFFSGSVWPTIKISTRNGKNNKQLQLSVERTLICFFLTIPFPMQLLVIKSKWLCLRGGFFIFSKQTNNNDGTTDVSKMHSNEAILYFL